MIKILITASALLLLSNVTSNIMLWPLLVVSLRTLSFLTLILLTPPGPSTVLVSNLLIFDALNTPLVILTFWISSLIILASTKVKKQSNKLNFFVTTVLVLNWVLVICFTASNLLRFYVFFEASLIPTLVLILGWGYQPERLQASLYLILYTLAASLPLLIAILFIFNTYISTSMAFPKYIPIPFHSLFLSSFWWLSCILAFLVKIPIFSAHLWLPKAHVEAPVAGSIVLAGILLKLGSYGLLRLTTLFQPLNLTLNFIVSSLAVWGAAITSIICLRQTDIKALIAYSSVGHIGLLTAGLISTSYWGLQGTLLIIISHGLCSSAIFAMSNIIYESSSTRSLYLTKGLINLFPALAIWWFLFNAANMAAPPFINLLGELTLFTRTISLNLVFILPLGLCRFLTGAYSLYLYTASFHGPTPAFIAASHLFSQNNYTLLLLHIAPLSALILHPSLIIL